MIISVSQYFRLPSRIQTGGTRIQVPVWQPAGRNCQDVLKKLTTNRGLWPGSLAGLTFMTVSLLFPVLRSWPPVALGLCKQALAAEPMQTEADHHV